MVLIVVSTSEFDLWKNPIPPGIFNILEIKSDECINLKRHDSKLIRAFQFFYGSQLENCTYAELKNIPYYFLDFYDIIQIPCYASSLFPESIIIRAHDCLLHYKDHHEYQLLIKNMKALTFFPFGCRLPTGCRIFR